MKSATVKWVNGFQFVSSADSGHSVVMDTGSEMGGADSAVRPAELLPMAVGGCTGVDVVNILSKKRLTIDNFELKVEADTGAEAPHTIEKFRVKYIITGDIPEQALQKAIELSVTKYCSVGILMAKGAKIEHSYELINGDNTVTGEL